MENVKEVQYDWHLDHKEMCLNLDSKKTAPITAPPNQYDKLWSIKAIFTCIFPCVTSKYISYLTSNDGCFIHFGLEPIINYWKCLFRSTTFIFTFHLWCPHTKWVINKNPWINFLDLAAQTRDKCLVNAWLIPRSCKYPNFTNYICEN